MEKKILLGTLGGTIAAMLIAGIIFAGLLGKTTQTWMQENAACLNELNMVWWVAGSLVQGLFLAILIQKFGISTFSSGAVAGAWITFFMILWFGIFNASTFKAYTWSWLPLDLIGNTIAGAVAGGVIGWIYGKVK